MFFTTKAKTMDPIDACDVQKVTFLSSSKLKDLSLTSFIPSRSASDQGNEVQHNDLEIVELDYKLVAHAPVPRVRLSKQHTFTDTYRAHLTSVSYDIIAPPPKLS